MLTRQKPPGTPYAGLHLIHDKENILFPAERRDPGNIVRLERDNAALALHQFQHDGAGIGIRGLFQRGKVTCGHIVKICGERPEVVVEHILPGGGQGSQRAAVERIDEGDDLIAGGAVGVHAVFAGALDGTLVGLGTRIAEENGIQPGAGAERLRKRTARLGIIQVGGVLQGSRLPGHGAHPCGVAVPQRIDADAGGKVEVLPALGVPRNHALARHQRDRAAGVGVEDVVVITGNNFFGIQLGDPLFIIRKSLPLRGKAARFGAFPLGGRWPQAG